MPEYVLGQTWVVQGEEQDTVLDFKNSRVAKQQRGQHPRHILVTELKFRRMIYGHH